MTQHEKYAQKLIASGYRATSNRYKMVARLDRPDWREHMAIRHSPWSLEEGMKWVNCLGHSATEHYLRVYSRDRLEGLPRNVFDAIKKAPMPTEYLELVA